ncbi:ATPase, F0 complex, subunit J [Suillus ampliporus]|nr:ATPase, F0 complex, subunit J [Suillus ampliporus]
MAFLGLRKWSTPACSISRVLRPMAPFLAASAVTFYLVSKMQEMGVRSETYAKDPKNPYGAQIAKEAHH